MNEVLSYDYDACMWLVSKYNVNNVVWYELIIKLHMPDSRGQTFTITLLWKTYIVTSWYKTSA